MNEPTPTHSIPYATKIIALGVFMSVGGVAAAAAVIYATDIFLLLILAILFGVFLTRVSGWLAEHTPLPYGGTLAAVTTVVVLLIALGAILFGMQVHDQITRASKHLDEGVDRLQELADRFPAVKSVLASTPFVRKLFEDGDKTGEKSPPDDAAKSSSDKSSKEQNALKSVAQRAATVVEGIFKTTLGLIVNSLLIFFVGLFIAIAPGMYRDGLVKLFPPARRQRTCEVMNLMGDALWNWLVGRLGSMLVTGAGAAGLLWVLGVPMAGSLGIVTALLTFIPNIGAVVALMLSILFALPQGGTVVLLVVLGYMALQLIESYVVTPLIQQHQVSLPPALLISFQALMGVLFGFLGAAVASPLLAAAKVGVEEAYVKDVLEAGEEETSA